jgi:hypothetical protein
MIFIRSWVCRCCMALDFLCMIFIRPLLNNLIENVVYMHLFYAEDGLHPPFQKRYYYVYDSSSKERSTRQKCHT